MDHFAWTVIATTIPTGELVVEWVEAGDPHGAADVAFDKRGENIKVICILMGRHSFYQRSTANGMFPAWKDNDQMAVDHRRDGIVSTEILNDIIRLAYPHKHKSATVLEAAISEMDNTTHHIVQRWD
jgi:hypothetical protein